MIALAITFGLTGALIFQNESVSASSTDQVTEGNGRGNNGFGSGGMISGSGTNIMGMGQGTYLNEASSVLVPLTDTEKDALTQAILEEYGALNLYQNVISQFGNVYPFSNIALSEQMHVNALVRQANKYGVEVPTNPGLQTQTTYASLTEACQAGVAAETEDSALYDELEKVVTHSDILSVFSTLQSASLNSHLPAFQTCD